jgi:hypothetical protein
MIKLKDLLQERLTESVINSNFWEWFGNSKVVDSSGKPLTVYRTQKKKYKHGDYREYKHIFGIYFSQDKESTKIYGDVTEQYFLKLENPKILRGIEHDEMWNLSIITKQKYSELTESGHDGAIWLKNGKMYEIVVFNQNQIKSTQNDGEWGVNSNNIYS